MKNKSLRLLKAQAPEHIKKYQNECYLRFIRYGWTENMARMESIKFSMSLWENEVNHRNGNLRPFQFGHQ